jgi:hypothetical protein
MDCYKKHLEDITSKMNEVSLTLQSKQTPNLLQIVRFDLRGSN